MAAFINFLWGIVVVCVAYAAARRAVQGTLKDELKKLSIQPPDVTTGPICVEPRVITFQRLTVMVNPDLRAPMEIVVSGGNSMTDDDFQKAIDNLQEVRKQHVAGFAKCLACGCSHAAGACPRVGSA